MREFPLFDIIKAIAIWTGIMLVGVLIGIFWYTQHGGQWWVIPLCAIAAPSAVLVVGIGYAFATADLSH